MRLRRAIEILRKTTNKVKDLIEWCKFIQNSQDFNDWEKIECEIFLEDWRQDELAKTFEIMKNLEFANSNTLSKLFQHKIAEIAERRKSAYFGNDYKT